MRAPQPWPASSETDWRLWRGYLDDVQMPHLATLKREADAEIARIVRCRYGGREPKRPAECRNVWASREVKTCPQWPL